MDPLDPGRAIRTHTDLIRTVRERRHTLSQLGALVALTVALATSAAAQENDPYDLVLSGGRVMDPESGLDAVRSLGIRDGRIAAIFESYGLSFQPPER